MSIGRWRVMAGYVVLLDSCIRNPNRLPLLRLGLCRNTFRSPCKLNDDAGSENLSKYHCRCPAKPKDAFR